MQPVFDRGAWQKAKIGATERSRVSSPFGAASSASNPKLVIFPRRKIRDDPL